MINSIIGWWMRWRLPEIEFFMNNPHEVQEKWFKDLIKTAENTKWGKKYDYKSINSASKFKRTVPVNDYEGLKPFINKVMKGEKNVLWPSEIKWFSKSSGTTSGRSKYIPVSSECLEECHYKGGRDIATLYYSNNPDSEVFMGKGVGLVGSLETNKRYNGSKVGDISSIIISNLPIWAQYFRIPSVEDALIADFEKKLERIVDVAVNEEITNLLGVPTWILVLLNKMLEKTGKKNILELWPNLELFVHGAVNFAPYRDQFHRLIPSSNMKYMETYNASEGFFAIQDQPESEEMLLLLDHGIYYEFIPMDQVDKDHPKTLSLEEVELETNYAMVISTNAGLWRYKIGDTISFTSKTPYRIKITGRTTHFINAFGEEVIVDNADKALVEACHNSAAIVKDYTAGPIYIAEGKKGGHEWLIEFEREPADMQKFTEDLDKSLREINSDYDAKRYKDIALTIPVVHSVKEGTFYNWMKKRNKLGGQNKVPRLSNDRKFLDDILNLIKEE